MSGFDEIAVAPGPWLQLYRGAMRGGRAELLRRLDECARLAVAGVIAGVMLHGFPRELEREAASLAAACRSRSLPFAWSWGLDGTEDNDRTRLTAREKGECAGRVLAAHPDSWGALDAEGRWDTDGGDGMSEAGALELGSALRALAPRAVVCDQPWFAPDQHGEVRQLALPLGKGGPIRGFPTDEFARDVQFRAPQLYWTNWARPDRYRYLCTWSEREWATMEAALGPAGLTRPRTITVQGYGHEKDPWALADALLSRRDRPVIVWCDPWPTEITLRVLRVGPELKRRGHLVTGRDHLEAVKAFQRVAGLRADGLAGYDTLRCLGL